MQGHYRELIKNVGLITVGKALTKIVGILILPFYTTYLSPSDYGYVDMIAAYCALFLQPVTLCIDSAVFIFPNGKNEKKKKKYYSSGFFISFIPIFIFCMFMYGLMLYSQNFNKDSFLGILSRNSFILSMLVVSGFFSDFLQQMLRSLNRISCYALIGVLQSIGMIVLSLISLPIWGAKGYLYSLFLSSLIVVLFVFVQGKYWKWLSIKSVSFRYYIQMLKYSFPLIPGPIMLWVQSQSNRPILASCYGLATVGIFGFALRFPATLSYFSDSLCKSWEISALREYLKPGFSTFYNNFIVMFFGVGSIFCFLFPIAIEPVFKVLIKEEFHIAIKYIPIVTLGVFWGVSAQLLGTNLTVMKQSYKFLLSGIVSMIVIVIGNWTLIPRFGIWGACISMSTTTLAVMIIRYVLSDSLFRIESIIKIWIDMLILIVWVMIYSFYGNNIYAKVLITVCGIALSCLVFMSNIKGIFVCCTKKR